MAYKSTAYFQPETFIENGQRFIMTQECVGNCCKSCSAIAETSLISTIRDFLESLESINNNPMILQQFYDYIKMKFNIPCEKGMLFIEKVTMNNVFRTFKLKADAMNSLANKKVELYQWIAPRHMDIKRLNFRKILDLLRKVELTEVPSVKVYYLMTAIQKLYGKVGKAAGLDDFFPYFIYCLIKANVKDIYAHIHYINLFKRKYDNSCKNECNHGFQIPVVCECLISKDWQNEEEYYLTTALAAVDYVARLEFYNLKIDHREFDENISGALHKVRPVGERDESSSTFEPK